MMEKVVTWAINKAVTEDVDTGITVAALMGAALDGATFVALGVPGRTAFAAGAATGAGHHLYKKIKGEKQA
jgi:hypothetical protein